MHLSTRVPLILKVPGNKPGNTSSLVETSDIFPTLCAFAGMDLPNSVQGRDFSKLLTDPQTPFRDSIYNRFGRGDAIITETFSYTSYGKEHMLYDLKNDPQENINIAGNPEHMATAGKIKVLLKQRQQEAAQYKTGSKPGEAGATEE